MAAFALDTAVTALGHFGTGFTAAFDVHDDEPCSLQVLCNNVEQLLECCANVTEYCQSILQVVTQNRGDIVFIKNEQTDMRNKLRLLIAAVERTKKGRL